MASFLNYLKAAMRSATYERMESGRWFASIPGFPGLWADGASIEDAREDLYSALDEWIAVHALIGQNQLPVIDGVNLFEPPKKMEM